MKNSKNNTYRIWGAWIELFTLTGYKGSERSVADLDLSVIAKTREEAERKVFEIITNSGYKWDTTRMHCLDAWPTCAVRLGLIGPLNRAKQFEAA